MGLLLLVAILVVVLVKVYFTTARKIHASTPDARNIADVEAKNAIVHSPPLPRRHMSSKSG